VVALIRGAACCVSLLSWLVSAVVSASPRAARSVLGRLRSRKRLILAAARMHSAHEPVTLTDRHRLFSVLSERAAPGVTFAELVAARWPGGQSIYALATRPTAEPTCLCAYRYFSEEG
jgi:hypothetical protein